jgi:hypothetical protein
LPGDRGSWYARNDPHAYGKTWGIIQTGASLAGEAFVVLEHPEKLPMSASCFALEPAFPLDGTLEQEGIAHYGNDSQRTKAEQHEPQGEESEEEHQGPQNDTADQQGNADRGATSHDPPHSIDPQEVEQQLNDKGCETGWGCGNGGRQNRGV